MHPNDTPSTSRLSLLDRLLRRGESKQELAEINASVDRLTQQATAPLDMDYELDGFDSRGHFIYTCGEDDSEEKRLYFGVKDGNLVIAATLRRPQAAFFRSMDLGYHINPELARWLGNEFIQIADELEAEKD